MTWLRISGWRWIHLHKHNWATVVSVDWIHTMLVKCTGLCTKLFGPASSLHWLQWNLTVGFAFSCHFLFFFAFKHGVHCPSENGLCLHQMHATFWTHSSLIRRFSRSNLLLANFSMLLCHDSFKLQSCHFYYCWQLAKCRYNRTLCCLLRTA